VCSSDLITKVALHHQFSSFHLFWNTKRTSKHAVGTPYTPGSICRMNYSVAVFGDRIGWTNIGTSRIFAMHAHLYSRLNRMGPVYIVHMDHGFLAICLTFCTSSLTGMASDAALHVHKKFHIRVKIPLWFCHNFPFLLLKTV